MSGKRATPLENPPHASSSDEDDEVETTDDESSPNPSPKKPALATPKKLQASDSESGSDESTDSDSETERNVQVKTPPTSSVVVKNQDSKKEKPLAKSSTKKRALSETDEGAASTDAKKVKTGSETKKTYFQRVWSEEDEIAALQGIIDYKKETGLSPYDDSNAYFRFVKKSISFDVSKTQVMEKLRSLKKKYESNLGKGKSGEEPTFSKSHDRKAFDLSKFVWGADGVIALDSAVKSNGKSKKSRKSLKELKQELASSSLLNGKSSEEEVTNKGEASGGAELDEFVKSVLVKALVCFGVDDLSAQQGWSKLALEDKKRFEEQWKVLQLKEFEFYAQKSGFIHEVVTKMAEAFRPNP